MSDVGSLLTPSGPAVAGPAGAASLPLGDVGLERLPQRLSQLSRPVVITGTVVGQTADGATRLRTQAGEVVMRTATPLPNDTPVTLQIGAGQPPSRASAFLTAQPGANPAAAALAALPMPAGAEQPAARQPRNVAAAPPQTTPETEVPPPQPGTVVPAQLLSAGGRAAPAPQAAPNPPPLARQAPMPGPGTPGPGQPAAPAPALVPGAPLAVRILETPATLSAGQEVAAPQGGPVLSGTIAGSTANGQPVLVTPQGSLALAIRGPLPQGTKLTVELVDPRQLVFSHPAETTDGKTAPWSTLSETLTNLGGLDGALAQTLLGSVVPQPNRKLAAALTFFLDAIRRGDAKSWLGEEASEALEESGHEDVLSRLTDEFRTQAREAAQAPPGEWRALTLPLFDGTGFQRLDLFVKVRRDDDDEAGSGGKGGGERSHRFILDLDLSRFGALQLDGLVKSKSRHFDLILRSRAPLPDSLRAELIEGFSASLDAVGYAGGLAFQPGARGWVKPPPPPRRPSHGFVA